jgi:hypothetical protein
MLYTDTTPSDNEYFQSGFGNAQYFAELEAAYHNSPVVVPLTYNDPGEERNFINGTVRSTGFSVMQSRFLQCTSNPGRSGYIWVTTTSLGRMP